MMNESELHSAYKAIKSEAIELAGALPDIPHRAAALERIYTDSQGNHAFSLIAAHGAHWGARYFDRGGTVARLMGYRYFYSARERAYRLGLLESFATTFREVNRQVCIDTYTNYHFTKRFGHYREAHVVMPPTLLDVLRAIHAAAREGRTLKPAEMRRAFTESFQCEQEATVAPGVKKAVSEFDCPILRTLILRPVVRFPFFPRMKRLFFRDFSNTEERIAKGLVVFELAQRAGWDRVAKSLDQYPTHRPADLFQTAQVSEEIL